MTRAGARILVTSAASAFGWGSCSINALTDAQRRARAQSLSWRSRVQWDNVSERRREEWIEVGWFWWFGVNTRVHWIQLIFCAFENTRTKKWTEFFSSNWRTVPQAICPTGRTYSQSSRFAFETCTQTMKLKKKKKKTKLLETAQCTDSILLRSEFCPVGWSKLLASRTLCRKMASRSFFFFVNRTSIPWVYSIYGQRSFEQSPTWLAISNLFSVCQLVVSNKTKKITLLFLSYFWWLVFEQSWLLENAREALLTR